MKNVYYTFLLLLLFSASSAQTTLFNETFNSGGANWVLNTADAGSTAGATGNYWVINNAYNSFFGNTPAQPGAIVGAPNSGYLHIRSPLTQNATFLAPADGNKFAKMTNGISTLGYTNVSFNFWYLCYGDQVATDSYFGRTYYSIDGGNTWILNPTTYSQINTWTQTTVSNPAFDNQPDLRIAFMWVQNSANEFVASDPTFSVDDFKITGVSGGGSAPVASFTLSNTSLCSGQCVQLTSTSTGQIDTYQWTTTGGTPASSTANAVNVCYANPGTYTITLTVTNANGTDSETNTITVTAPPAISSNPQTSTICSGQTISLQVSNANPGQLTTYSWSPNSGLSSTTGSSVSANPIVTTTYTIVGTTSNGCTSSTTSVVTVNPQPAISVAPATLSLCAGGTSTLTASGAASYNWAPSTGLSAVTGSSVTATPLNSTTYTITGTASNGCTGSTTSVVTVNPLPALTSTPALSICNGLSGTLTATGAATYSWTPSTGINAITGSTVTANPTTSTTYTVTGVSSAGCSSTSTSVVTVNTSPTISVNSATICSGSSVNLLATGADSYTWSPAIGLNTTTGSVVTASVNQNTTYTVSGLSTAGCIGTATAVITVGNSLNIGVNSTVICLGASTVLTASGASSYTWSPNTALNQSTGSIVTATPLETITYTVSGFDANGCSGEALSVVAVKPPPTIVVINDSICKGQIASLIVSGANTFSWSPSSGLNMTSGNSVQANIINTTTYVVTGTDANGCTASEEVIAFVYPETNGTISGLNATYFTNDPSTMMTGNPPGGAFSGPGVSGTNFNPATAGPGTHNITYTFTDANGCQGTTSFTVTVNNPLAIQGPTDEPYQALIYPNPSSGDVLMQLYTLKPGICTLDILDITGRQLQTSQSFIQSGANQIPFKIDHAGIYLVRLTMHQHVRILKLVVE